MSGVERTKDGYVQVICGAENVREDLLVAWLPPGSTVPATRDKDPFILEVREMRGETSNGMLASPAELGLSDDHRGILEINPKDIGAELVKPGTELKKLYDLDDVVIDIENKMFTHRPDCFGILGIARELAGVAHQAFKSPSWYLDEPRFTKAQGLELITKNEAPGLVPRLMTVAMTQGKNGLSPTWLQAGLTRVGIKPISTLVDLTNFYMQLTGQPLHAYDYDKVKALSDKAATIIARRSKKGETLELLNGKTITFQDNATIVIATDKQVIGLAGVMGGAETEVDATTQNIILECAAFDMYSVRRTSMKYGLFTDAVTRFTKGQSPLQNDRILAQVMHDVTDLTGATQASVVFDEGPRRTPPKSIVLTADFVNERLGSNFAAADIAKLLTNVELHTTSETDNIRVTPSFWRTDLEIPEDIVEEVGRLYGYDELPIDLPRRPAVPATENKSILLKSELRKVLAAAGANELLTYSFVHGDLLSAVGQDKSHAYKLGNALSPNLQYYRLSLTPSLLEKVHPNIKTGVDEFALFEINKVHTKQIVGKDKLPTELEHLALVVAADSKIASRAYEGAPYYQAAKYLWHTLAHSGTQTSLRLVPLTAVKLEHPYDAQLTSPFEPKRSAAVVSTDGRFWGVVGEYRTGVKKQLKLPDFCAGFEINLSLFTKLPQQQKYRPLSKYPASKQDISFVVKDSTAYDDLVLTVTGAVTEASEASGYWTSLQPVDIYQKPKQSKHITLRLTIVHPDRTLTTQEVNSLLDDVAAVAEKKIGAKRI